MIFSMGIAPASSVELRNSGLLCFIRLCCPDVCSTRKTSDSVDRESEELILIILRKTGIVIGSY